MKTLIKSSSVILILLIFFSSCKKDAVDVNSDFVGNWEQFSQLYYVLEINIPADGDATAHSVWDSQPTDWSGVAQIKEKKNELIIDSKTWHIDLYPYKDSDTTWVMILDGDSLRRPQ